MSQQIKDSTTNVVVGESMLYPPINDLIKITGNRYSLVIAASKRARQIAEDAEADGRQLEDKPVKIAIKEIYDYKVICRIPQNGEACFARKDG